MIRNLIIEKNVAYLNQAQGTPLTIELLVFMIGIDSFTIFGQELLEMKCNTLVLTSSPALQKYLQEL